MEPIYGHSIYPHLHVSHRHTATVATSSRHYVIILLIGFWATCIKEFTQGKYGNACESTSSLVCARKRCGTGAGPLERNSVNQENQDSYDWPQQDPNTWKVRYRSHVKSLGRQMCQLLQIPGNGSVPTLSRHDEESSGSFRGKRPTWMILAPFTM